MDAVFRVDGSAIIGGGHISRCLTLADALAARGWTCSFVTISDSILVMPGLRRSAHTVVEIDDADINAPYTLAALGSIDLLVVDHYGLDDAFETPSRAFAKRLMVLDDIPERKHDCDILLDQTLGREAQAYDGLLRTAQPKLLLGTDYALLRPEFAAHRDQALNRNRTGLERVLVSFGATDPWGLCAPAARASCAAGIANVDIAVGSLCPHLDELCALANEFEQVTIHLDGQIALLMTAADVAIGAAGSTSWERCCLGLPTVLAVAVDNQRLAAQALVKTGAVALVSVDDTSPETPFLAALNELQENISRLLDMSAAARNICDGQGASRVVDAIEKHFL